MQMLFKKMEFHKITTFSFQNDSIDAQFHLKKVLLIDLFCLVKSLTEILKLR